MKTIALFLLTPAAAMAQLRVAPADAPARITVASATERGTRLVVTGRVMGSDGRPIPDASVYLYHTDANGEYVPGQSGGSERPRLFGYLRSDSEGKYSFSTIKPGSYPNTRNPGHIHFEVTAPNYAGRGYEIVFEGDPYLSPAFRSQAREPFGGVEIVTARSAAGGAVEVAHDIRLRSAR